MEVELGERPKVHGGNVSGHGTGRLPAPDVRDGDFRLSVIRKQLPKPAGVAAKTSRNWNVDHKRLPVDQGPTPRCVGFSLATCLVVGPETQRAALPTRDAAEDAANGLYVDALDLDEWDGNDPNFGTSVRAGQKAAVAAGYIGGYAWGESVADAADFLLNFGPVIAGTVWPDSMMEADGHGYLNVDPNSPVDGPHAAGHAYCLAGVNTTAKNPDGTKGRFTIVQSWGTGWGRDGKGTAYISFRTFGALLLAGGEVCFPTEKRLLPAPIKLPPAAEAA